jgi:hypothetical protein
MLVEEAIKFLEKVSPLQFLDFPSLKDITADITIEFYPKGAIQCRGVPAPEHHFAFEKDEANFFLRNQKKDVIKASRLSPMALKPVRLPICRVH